MATPCRPHGQRRDAPSHVPCESRRPGSCRLNAGHHLASNRAPARPCSRSPRHGHGFDVTSFVTTRQQRFGFTHLPGPHLTPHRAPFPHRSPRRSSANAACGGLKPPPRRAASKGLPSSLAQHRLTQISPTHADLHSSFMAHAPAKRRKSRWGRWNFGAVCHASGSGQPSQMANQHLPGVLV